VDRKSVTDSGCATPSGTFKINVPFLDYREPGLFTPVLYLMRYKHQLTSSSVRLLCLHHQYVSVLHHCADWPRVQHSGWSRKDMLNRRSRLDHIWPCSWRQIRYWSIHRYRRNNIVSHILLLAPLLLNLAFSLYCYPWHHKASKWFRNASCFLRFKRNQNKHKHKHSSSYSKTPR